MDTPEVGYDGLERKVLGIFTELAGERATRLVGNIRRAPALDVIAAALAESYGTEARKVAWHMAEWNWNAAFIVALHLFPERFTPEEIEEGIGLFLTHAPNHIREACRLTGQYVWENFPEEDFG